MIFNEIILDTEFVKYKKIGNELFMYATLFSSPGNNITKLSKDIYRVNRTNEMRSFRDSGDYKSKKLLEKSLFELKDLIKEYVKPIHNCIGITLTYKEEMRNLSQVNKHFEKFVEKIRRKFGSFEYICVVEPQKRGSWHIHLVLIFPSKAPYIDNIIISNFWRHGFTYTESIKSAEQLANYYFDYNLDLKYATALELYADQIDKYSIYQDLNENGKMEKYVKGIAILMIPNNMNVYRHSRGIKAIKPRRGIKENVMSNNNSAKLASSYTKTIYDDMTHEIVNVIRYERYMINVKKGGESE